MERRTFLKNALATSALATCSSLMPRWAQAEECAAVSLNRTLVNVMLQGGADFRFLFMPSPDHPEGSVVDALWDARRILYDQEYPDYASMFDGEYLSATDPASGIRFGIHRSAAFLHSQFLDGNVAVVANAFCSRNRRHDQSILNADAGVPDLAQLNFDRDGWGGRLVEQISGGGNVVELGSSVSVFSKGSAPGARMSQVVHAQDMRNMSLAGQNANQWRNSRRNVLARALNAWYEGRGTELSETKAGDWVYRPFVDHRAAIQKFGSAIESRLAQCQALPEELQTLNLGNDGFAQQCRNLFDACQLPDVLDMRVMSMSYGGWDTHDNEAAEISANLEDLFGAAGGLATAVPALDSIPTLAEPAREQLVFYFASDFGRQIRANGTAGTDHGRGTYSILMGPSVRGGLYGEAFPLAESQPDSEGRIPLETQGADIQGKTSTERILAQACEWVEPGSSEAVFPGAPVADIEQAGMLDSLFS